MQKIKIELDFSELSFLETAFNYFFYELKRGSNLQLSRNLHEDHLIKSILITLKSKININQHQKKYTKKLYYHEIYALYIYCTFILDFLELNIQTTAIFILLQEKTEKHLFQSNNSNT